MSNNSAYSAETIYTTHEDSSQVMSEKVQALAGSIYKEFERMIAQYDQDVVKGLMPLLVNVLECLDNAYQTNQLHDVELELLKEDNEQLITQYEREKAARKHSEQKLLEAEDVAEGEKKDLLSRLESLDSIVRMLELKQRNSLDHASRLEERENELKKEYTKLHDRYTDLLKTHLDYMERTKLLLSTAGDRNEVRGRLGLHNPMARSSGPMSFGFASLEGTVNVADQSDSIAGSPVSLSSSPPSLTLGAELAAVPTMERAHQTDTIKQQSQATSPASPTANKGKSKKKLETRTANTLYEELSFQDMDTSGEADESGDITGSWVHPGEYASSGMGKEVENLILENNELLATKNALNVVKDDLIAKVDELTCEQEILKEKVSELSGSRQMLKDKVTGLEEELKALKEAISAGAGNTTTEGGEDESDVPMAQRKRFTRVEMARVLMERNQYKERLMELQDAVHWTEMVRASRNDTSGNKKNKQTIWSFFSKLFNSTERPQRPLSTPHIRSVGNVQPALGIRHSQTQADFLQTQLADPSRRHDRGEQFRQMRARIRKEDGRMQAYGWSLPNKTGQNKPSPYTSLSSGGVPVPVPVYCRPLLDAESRTNLVCAAGVNVYGGKTSDGGHMIGDSVFYSKDYDLLLKVSNLAEEMNKAESKHSPEVEEINKQIESTHIADLPEKDLSSIVWICSSARNHGVVVVIDANNPSELIETFKVPDKYILCLASVPGASEDVYKEFEEKEAVETDKTEEVLANTSSPHNQSTTGNDETKDDIVGNKKLVQATLLTPPPSPGCSLPSTPGVLLDDAKLSRIKVTEPIYNSPDESSPQCDILGTPECAVDAISREEIVAEAKEDLPVERKMSTILATMWLGTKSGNLYVYSSFANYGRCLFRLKLHEAITAIVHCSLRCVVALADGKVAIFSRQPDGQWDFKQYYLLTLGDPKCAVRCLTAVGCTVWCGYRNKIHVVEPRSCTIVHTLEAHARQESQVRQMAWLGDGVWVSIKMDSTLRLYHAHTYQHLNDVDIEPYVSKMLGTGKLGFSFVRITALLISSGRLWIGTSNGVVISVPLSDMGKEASGTPGQSALMRNLDSPSDLIPSCSMAHAQLSFHGLREAVTFFVAVPGNRSAPHSHFSSPPHEAYSGCTAPMLVMAGGEGYIDFRTVTEQPPSREGHSRPDEGPHVLDRNVGRNKAHTHRADSGMEDSVAVEEGQSVEGTCSPSERTNSSHLIIWEVAQ